MEKEFVLYGLALELKQLGFDEPCFKYIYMGDTGNNVNISCEVVPSSAKNYNEVDVCVSTPTYSQSFRWFREKHELFHSIIYQDDNSGPSVFDYEILSKRGKSQIDESTEFDTHEEAELACLKKLIEIVKTK
jgi:hypothetical protein